MIELAITSEPLRGVYFLIKGDVIVYVGSATNVYARIGEHISHRIRNAYWADDVKEFDRILFLAVPEERPTWKNARGEVIAAGACPLLTVESSFIRYLRPPLNRDSFVKGRLSDGERGFVVALLDVVPAADRRLFKEAPLPERTAPVPVHTPALPALTDAAVRALPLVERGAAPCQYIERDGLVAGFGVVVGTTSKTFRVRTERWTGGKRKELYCSLGRFPDVKVGDARRRALAWLKDAKRGRVQEGRA